MNKALIIGQQPLGQSLARQYRQRGWSVETSPDQCLSSLDYNEIALLPDHDSQGLQWLHQWAQALDGNPHRPLVHWLLHSPATLRMVQTNDLPTEINQHLEVWPFTLEEAWAQRLMASLPGLHRHSYPPLDRQPISPTSTSTVHLVILGFDTYAQALARHAALVAHYPNYRSTDALPLRTRITIIDHQLSQRRDTFVAQHRHLFDHSHWREVDIARQQTLHHRPLYRAERMDFVDVEWEFVEGDPCHPIVQQHLEAWASTPQRQLTLAISHPDDEQNLTQALTLPPQLLERHIPILLRLSSPHQAQLLQTTHPHLLPFGMEGHGYDTEQPLMKLAKMLNYFYHSTYTRQSPPTDLPWTEVEAAWKSLSSYRLRFSNLANVMTMATKLRSLGHDTTDPNTFYALTQAEIEQLAPCEHNRWSVERLLMGTRPLSPQERTEVDRDISLKKQYKLQRNAHYDLCAFEELRPDETGQDVRLYDHALIACIPLMVKTFNAQ